MGEYFTEWLKQLPLVTKILFFTYLTTGIVAQLFPWFFFNSSLFLEWNTIRTVLISFLYFGKLLSVPFWYHLVLFLCYSKALELEYSRSTRNRKNYSICLLSGVLLILILSRVEPIKIDGFSQSFVFYIVYLYNNYKDPKGTTVFTPALFVDNKYMTILLIFVQAVFGNFFWMEYFVGLLAGYIFMKLEQAGFIRMLTNIGQ